MGSKWIGDRNCTPVCPLEPIPLEQGYESVKAWIKSHVKEAELTFCSATGHWTAKLTQRGPNGKFTVRTITL